MRSINSLFGRFLESTSGKDHLVINFMRELWPDLVGEEISSHSRPVYYEKKRLLIEVYSDVWLVQLQNLKDMLKKSINENWNTQIVERIEIRIGPK